jgi:hypothetical protein
MIQGAAALAAVTTLNPGQIIFWGFKLQVAK